MCEKYPTLSLRYRLYQLPKHKTQIKCAKEILRYPYVICMITVRKLGVGQLGDFQSFPNWQYAFFRWIPYFLGGILPFVCHTSDLTTP